MGKTAKNFRIGNNFAWNKMDLLTSLSSKGSDLLSSGFKYTSPLSNKPPSYPPLNRPLPPY